MNDNPRRDDIVSGPPKWRWPFAASKGEDLHIGSAPRSGGGTVEGAPPKPALPRIKAPRRPRVARRPGVSSKPAGWKSLAVNVVVGAAFLYHALPQLVRMGGTVGIVDAKGMVVDLLGILPIVGGFDPAQTLVPAVSAWLWQPLVAAFGAAVLRLVAVNMSKRDPLTAIWIAATALGVDLATWLFMGLKLWGTAFTDVEGQALIALLKAEGAALFILFLVMAPLGRRRLGQTDADWNGDN